MLYCAFTMEAFLNHIGSLLLKTWDKSEIWYKPKQKLKCISENLEITFDLSKRPFQTFNDLFVYRNWLVHGKTEEVHEPTIIETSIGPDFDFESEWEKWTNYKTAKRFNEDTCKMMNELYHVKRLESSGMWNLGGAQYKHSEKERLLGK